MEAQNMAVSSVASNDWFHPEGGLIGFFDGGADFGGEIGRGFGEAGGAVIRGYRGSRPDGLIGDGATDPVIR